MNNTQTTITDTQATTNHTKTTTENKVMTAQNTQNQTDNTLVQGKLASDSPENTIKSLAEGSSGFFTVVKPKVAKKIADCNAKELRGFIRIKLFPRKDGLITVYSTLAGLTPLLIGGEKSFQVKAITKEAALETILTIPEHTLDSLLLIAQSDYVSAKKKSSSDEAKEKRKERKALQVLAKRNKLKEETADLKLKTALFEAKKAEEEIPCETNSKK